MSRIEQLIGEIEEYIDSCKYQPLSNTKILVNKEEMEELLVELRLRVPEEIKKYQKIISQQDAILADAKAQADMMLMMPEPRPRRWFPTMKSCRRLMRRLMLFCRTLRSRQTVL